MNSERYEPSLRRCRCRGWDFCQYTVSSLFDCSGELLFWTYWCHHLFVNAIQRDMANSVIYLCGLPEMSDHTVPFRIVDKTAAAKHIIPNIWLLSLLCAAAKTFYAWITITRIIKARNTDKMCVSVLDLLVHHSASYVGTIVSGTYYLWTVAYMHSNSRTQLKALSPGRGRGNGNFDGGGNAHANRVGFQPVNRGGLVKGNFRGGLAQGRGPYVRSTYAGGPNLMARITTMPTASTWQNRLIAGKTWLLIDWWDIWSSALSNISSQDSPNRTTSTSLRETTSVYLLKTSTFRMPHACWYHYASDTLDQAYHIESYLGNLFR